MNPYIPFFYNSLIIINKLTVIRTISMKNNEYVELITQLCSLKQINNKIHPVMTLKSISQQSDCSTCKILINVVDELNQNAEDTCFKYNNLLRQTQTLIQLNYQYLQQQQMKYEQEFRQIQKDKYQAQSRIQQLQAELTEKNQTIKKFYNVLIEKDEYISLLEDRLQKQVKQVNDNSRLIQIQLLKHHKRQKSQIYNRLQTINAQLLNDNRQLKTQNHRLLQVINQLKDYNQRMQEDLAHANIKSPNIIGELNSYENNQDNQLFNQQVFNGTFNQIEKYSIFEHSPVQESKQSKQQSQYMFANITSNQKSVRQSFVQKGKALRDVLNISGQSSNYFQFQTRQKNQQSNADNYVSMSNNENMNSMNIIKGSQQKILKKNILQIKQFQVSQPVSHRTLEKQKPLKRSYNTIGTQKDTEPQASNFLDPYYSFFVLTIQSLKLNYKDMEKVVNIPLYNEWDNILEKKIPFNKWQVHLKQILLKRVNQKK